MDLSIRTLEIRKDEVSLDPSKAEIVSKFMPKPFMKYHIFHVPPSIKVTKRTTFKIKPDIICPRLPALNFHNPKKIISSPPTRPKEVSKTRPMDWSDVCNRRRGFPRHLDENETI